MPPPLFFDPNEYDLDRVSVTQEEIYRVLPQREEFMLLGGILVLDTNTERLIAFADVREDAWWTRGHIPEKPILPGVLMIEMAAHAAAYYIHTVLHKGGFLAFAGLDECKFRGIVEPPCRLLLLGKSIDLNPRKFVCAFQALLDGKLVFQAQLTGIPIA